MGSQVSQHVHNVDVAGDRRTVTATYRYGDILLSLVSQTKADADHAARRRWGEWDGTPCYSSPRSIYRDLTGHTARKTNRRGMYGEGRALI